MKTALLKRRSSGIAPGWAKEIEKPEIKPGYARIYRVVRQIPPGKVATYGQIAKIVDWCTARMVGYAMAALRGRTDVPWQRVINSKGEISTRSRGDGALRQRKLLEKEGIRFDPKGRVNLRKARWKGLYAHSAEERKHGEVNHGQSPDEME
ncbi:MAG: MGMT family protein [Syntrophaceae bacterium]|nr:MGMT family protein [Syntrophaceae bacterium]